MSRRNPLVDPETGRATSPSRLAEAERARLALEHPFGIAALFARLMPDVETAGPETPRHQAA